MRHDPPGFKGTKESFLRLMAYPSAWKVWEMYPDDLFNVQRADYEIGSEQGGEHFRYGAFSWWLNREMDAAEIAKYVALTFLDGDQLMAQSAREDIRNRQTLPAEVQAMLTLPPVED